MHQRALRPARCAVDRGLARRCAGRAHGEALRLGIAIWFHASVAILALTLAAIAGSFMVSYGSAKAEGIGVPVPPGVMRRAERSIASSDASKLVVIAINKATTTKVAGVVIEHSTVYTKAAVYTVTAAGGAMPVAAPGITAVATNAFRYTMPAQSISVIVPTP